MVADIDGALDYRDLCVGLVCSWTIKKLDKPSSRHRTSYLHSGASTSTWRMVGTQEGKDEKTNVRTSKGHGMFVTYIAARNIY